MATGKLSPSVAKLKLQFKAFRDERLNSTDKLVLAALVTFHNGKTGRLDPGYDEIAKRASLGRSTVIRAIPPLIQAGYLTSTLRPLKRGNMTNTYRLTGVTATHEVVSQRDPPSVTAGPPPSVTAGPKQSEVLQTELTVPPLRHPPSSLNTGTGNTELTTELTDGGVTEDTSGTTELTSDDGASVENICPEAQAQPQQATSRDVACLQDVDGGNAQAEPQHHESRDGAEKEQAVPPQQLHVFEQFSGKPLPAPCNMTKCFQALGGNEQALERVEAVLDGIQQQHDCDDTDARRIVAAELERQWRRGKSGDLAYCDALSELAPVVTAA